MMPLVTGFVLGLASSAHCVVMCGPLVLAIGPRRGAGSAWTALGRLLPYHAGRIAVYVALAFPAGWVAEAAGRGGLGIALGVVIAAVLLAAACGATRRPGWRGVSGLVGRRVARLAAVAASWRQICPRTAAVVAGMANGLVPCGLVYAAALAAAGWGTFAGAWAMMLGFGLVLCRRWPSSRSHRPRCRIACDQRCRGWCRWFWRSRLCCCCCARSFPRRIITWRPDRIVATCLTRRRTWDIMLVICMGCRTGAARSIHG